MRTEKIKNKKLTYIYKYVCKETELDIAKKIRRRDYVEARALFYALSHRYTKSSYALIGAYTNLDHATVLYGVKSFHNTIIKDNDYIRGLYEKFNPDFLLIENEETKEDTSLLNTIKHLRDLNSELVQENEQLKLNAEELMKFGRLLVGLNESQLERIYDKIQLSVRVMAQEKYHRQVEIKEMKEALL